MLFIGYFLANPQLVEGCTVGQCIADCEAMTVADVQFMLGMDNYDWETTIEAGRRFI